MAEIRDVAIVGGGAAGCAVAYYLTRMGIRPVIIERDGVGGKASGFSAGGLNPLQGAGIPGPLGPLAAASFAMHAELRHRLPQESGIDFHYKEIAMVNVAFDESEFGAMKETLEIFGKARGFSAHWMDADVLRSIEPRISAEAIRALYTYGNATLTSYEYTLALAEAAKRSGAEIRTGEVTGLETDGNKVTGVKLADGGIACNAVVIASGPWSGGAASWLGVKIPVEPLAGEIVRVEAPGGVLQQDFSGAGASLYQRADGLVWVGATEVRRGFDDQPSEEGRSTLLKGAVKLMPCLKDARIVKQTACLRPVTPDWLPIIGKAPGWENAFLATGAGKKGILISPGIGKATADLIASGKTDLPITPFAPERFA